VTYAAKILADSTASGVRLVTMEVTFPRFILAEFNTHRMLSRNSASSRAIPIERRIAQVRESPFVPEAFTKNKRGMQADEVLDEQAAADARGTWLRAAEVACERAEILAAYGVHKQHANRLLEPFVWHANVTSGTEWDNFFALRCHPAAQPEMQITARLMRDAMAASAPRELQPGDWHLPYVDIAHEGPGRRPIIYTLPGVPLTGSPLPHDATETEVCKLVREAFRPYVATSVVRCAALSYLRQDAERPLEETLRRHDEMVKMGHWSPFEHQAKVADGDDEEAFFAKTKRWGGPEFYGNFRAPWVQYRKTFDGEAVFGSRT
jgi:thymidylate synthase ThyX